MLLQPANAFDATVTAIKPAVKVALSCTHDCLQATARLYQFDQLQPEFLELANQYRNLQEDLDHATFTLHEFQKAAADQT